jgi:hypothetical protein
MWRVCGHAISTMESQNGLLQWSMGKHDEEMRLRRKRVSSRKLLMPAEEWYLVDTILFLTKCFINFPFKLEHDRKSCPVALGPMHISHQQKKHSHAHGDWDSKPVFYGLPRQISPSVAISRRASLDLNPSTSNQIKKVHVFYS